MKKNTQTMPILPPMLPGFFLPKRGRKPRTPQQVLAAKLASIKKKSFKQIGEIFGHFIPMTILRQEKAGAMSRRRIYTKENTFWAFLGQILDSDGGCKEVVRKLQSYASMRTFKLPSSSTASYCAARKKLEESTLYDIFQHTTQWASKANESTILQGRRVVVVDGTGISMPDTPENQASWPQLSSQKPGCGFPTGRICAYFSLENGGLLNYAIGNKKCHELPLFREKCNTFKVGDIFLGDKGFCSYFDIAKLQKDRGVDSVVTLARRKPVNRKTCLKELGADDLLTVWPKPSYNKVLSYSKEAWENLPDRVVMRQIKVQVNQPGFRCKEFYIVTTLTDPAKYPVEEIAALYFKRWEVELFFRDIKTTMGFDILRFKSPEMIRKEVLMYFIAYNCIRRLMYEAANSASIEMRTISFKGSLQAIRSWESRFGASHLNQRDRLEMMSDLLLALVHCQITLRPGRSEPRCMKRRPKPFQLLTKQRHEMREIQHRNRYRA